MSNLRQLTKVYRNFQEKQDSAVQELKKVQPWYQFGNDKFTVIPLVALALDITYFTQDQNSLDQVGDQGDRYEPGQIRALRIGAVGTIGKKNPWRYLFAAAYRAFDAGFNSDSLAEFTIFDYRLDIPTKIGTKDDTPPERRMSRCRWIKTNKNL